MCTFFADHVQTEETMCRFTAKFTTRKTYQDTNKLKYIIKALRCNYGNQPFFFYSVVYTCAAALPIKGILELQKLPDFQIIAKEK